MPGLPVTNGATYVSDADYEWAAGRPWHVGDTGYIKCYSGRAGGTPLRMHRLIMERIIGRKLTPCEFVDHINGDKLDNRRENLRLATKSENGMNLRPRKGCKSRYIGVCLDSSGNHRLKPWMAYLNVNQKRFYVGRFHTEEEAAWMRDQWALALHGDFAVLNFDYVSLTPARTPTSPTKDERRRPYDPL